MKNSKFLKKIDKIEEQTDQLYVLNLGKLDLLSEMNLVVNQLKKLGLDTSDLDFKEIIKIEEESVKQRTRIITEQIKLIEEAVDFYSTMKDDLEEKLYSDNPDFCLENISTTKDSDFKIYVLKDPIQTFETSNK